MCCRRTIIRISATPHFAATIYERHILQITRIFVFVFANSRSQSVRFHTNRHKTVCGAMSYQQLILKPQQKMRPPFQFLLQILFYAAQKSVQYFINDV